MMRKLLPSALFVPMVLSTPALADIEFVARTGSGPIKVLHSGLCPTVPGGNRAETVQIEQQPCSGASEQT